MVINSTIQKLHINEWKKLDQPDEATGWLRTQDGGGPSESCSSCLRDANILLICENV